MVTDLKVSHRDALFISQAQSPLLPLPSWVDNKTLQEVASP